MTVKHQDSVTKTLKQISLPARHDAHDGLVRSVPPTERNLLPMSDFTHLKPKEAEDFTALDVFPCPHDVLQVTFHTDELTASCPVTAQPDFYDVTISYMPDTSCIESKSLKLYLRTYATQQMFGEVLASQIARDIQQSADALAVRVILKQHVRGGITMTVEAEVTRT